MSNRGPAASHRRRTGALLTGVVLGFVALLAVPTAVPSASGASAPLPAVTGAQVLGTLLDGATMTVVSGLTHSQVSDTVTPLASTLSTRSYSVTLGVSVALPLLSLDLRTKPNAIWSWPSEIPEGPVALPPLTMWYWTVYQGSQNVTSSWTVVGGGQYLQATVPVAAATFTVTGRAAPVVPLYIDPSETSPYLPPSVGFALNSAVNNGSSFLPTNNPGYSTLARGLRPSIVRIDFLDMQAAGSWNAQTKSPNFNFSLMDRTFAFASSIGAQVLLTLSAGSWGDGNLLPTGMPLNTSLLVVKGATSGYFPKGAAYQTFIRVIAQHIISANESVEYWGIGNEVPLTNAATVGAFVRTFNTAAQQIHALLPTAKIGTDVMMNKTYLPTFAHFAQDVGFLSFHFYPSIGVCSQNGTFCPPAGPGNGTLDARLWMPFASIYQQGFYDPEEAQSAWRNITGTSIPVLDTESNLNGAGGGPLTSSLGTDPRQQNLFGAIWTISTLIDGANSNLSELTYFTFNGNPATPRTVSGPYGGWGYGMTAQAPGGKNVLYAPYWALHMWSNAIPAHATSVEAEAGVPGLVKVYAVAFGNQISLVAVNQVNVPVTLNVQVNQTGWVGNWSHTLDTKSYVQQYNPTAHKVVLTKSGVRFASFGGTSGPWSLKISGYGMATVRMQHGALGPLQSPSNGSANSSAPATAASAGAPAPASAPGTSPTMGSSLPTAPGIAAANEGRLSARWDA